ncbi:hypothetical protein PIROE2DRAFT_7128 [Piromyces sp. E2]|nr:hypothetical protein PIROE2DRAFT_7128 [Piromyces sp. E2]|eukprot:OUM65802.1 hypothetical protein PIROE2DRAFT_7128 [Piromyces sp. E2]
MNVKTFVIIIASLFSLGNAKNYDFKVVSILGEGYSLGVKYNNQVYPLKSTLFPLFTGTVNANNIKEYKYVALDQKGKVVEEENFLRTYSNETLNINEVYNSVKVPELPKPLKPMFKMGSEKFQPIPNNIIYNLYAKCNEKDYSFMTDEPFEENTGSSNNLNVNCTFTIISPKTTFQSPGTIHLIGWGSRKYKKLSWSVKLDEKFMGRKAFKLRAMPNEPTLIRERLATELYHAAGVPTQQGTYARVFINGDTYGLYTLVDSFSKNWIQGVVHGDTKAKIGVSYKLYVNGRTCSNFKYLGENYKSYYKTGTYQLDEFDKSVIDPTDEAAKWAPLIRFTKLYRDWNNKYAKDPSEAAIKALAKFLNIESLLRLMAIETLTAAFDNFWLYSSNAALYYNPERDNYQFISYDYDQSLGGWQFNEDVNYQTLIEDCITWAHPDDTVIDHSFINGLLSHPQIIERYKVILAKLSRSTFDPKTVSKYVHALADLIREDVSWNFEAIDKLHIAYDGHVNHYTFEDFESNLAYTPIHSVKDYRYDNALYGLMEWVEKKGDGCRAYTHHTDIQHDVNISDDYDVEVIQYSETPETTPTISSTTKSDAKVTIITTKTKVIGRITSTPPPTSTQISTPTSTPQNNQNNQYISVKFKGTLPSSKYYLGVQRLAVQPNFDLYQDEEDRTSAIYRTWHVTSTTEPSFLYLSRATYGNNGEPSNLCLDLGTYTNGDGYNYLSIVPCSKATHKFRYGGTYGRTIAVYDKNDVPLTDGDGHNLCLYYSMTPRISQCRYIEEKKNKNAEHMEWDIFYL